MEKSLNDNQLYLEKNLELRQLMETLSVEIRDTHPDQMAEKMLKYLKQTYGERATEADKSTLEVLRKEADRLDHIYKAKRAKKSPTKILREDVGSENETDEDNEDDYIDILPQTVSKQQQKGPRSSVSAEAFGVWNKKSNFQARVVQKSEDIKQKIMQRLKQSFMFSCLSEQEMSIVVGAMEERRYKAKDPVIKQGEDGNELFIVEMGTLSCFKLFSGKKEPTFLKQYNPGDVFGELALLYNAPRAASIIADGNCQLWVLDRETFNHIVKDASRNKREKYENFITKVKILETMEPYERSVLSDAFQEEKFMAGDFIIRQGDEGNKFYLVEEGTLIVSISFNQQEEAKEVRQYKPGDYFGERALLKNEPRAANVVAKTNCKLVTLDRHSFKRLMGPIEDVMKRNLQVYEQFYVSSTKIQ